MKTGTCLYCGETMRIRGRQKFCNRDHKIQYYLQKKPLKPYKCLYCGETFHAKQFNRQSPRYCCTAHQLKHTIPIKELECVDCGVKFTFKGRTTRLRCDGCRRKHDNKLVMVYRSLKDPSVKIGVGSGGNQHPRNEVIDTPEYAAIRAARRAHYEANKEGQRKTARSKYRDKKLLSSGEFCTVCLFNEDVSALVVHHIDMDRTNPDPGNLVVLCCNCHARLHSRIRGAMKAGNQDTPQKVFEQFYAGLRNPVWEFPDTDNTSNQEVK